MTKYKFTDAQGNKIIIKANNIEDAVLKLKSRDEASLATTLNSLVEDEKAAIEAYNVVIENYEGKLEDIALEVLKKIRDDERRHVENLYSILNGNITEKNLEDSIKDNLDDYRNAVKEAVNALNKINGKIQRTR